MMNDDAATTEHTGWIVAIRRVELVVVDQIIGVGPNLQPELILTVTAGLIAVDGRQYEMVVATVVDRTEAFVLRFPAA